MMGTALTRSSSSHEKSHSFKELQKSPRLIILEVLQMVIGIEVVLEMLFFIPDAFIKKVISFLLSSCVGL